MKRGLQIILAVAACFCGNSFAQTTPFTSGNLVVTRYGDGETPKSSVNVFIDEYDAANGNLVNSKKVEGVVGKSINATETEGYISLSTDGTKLSFIAYDATSTETVVPSASVGYRVITVDGNYSINNSTVVDLSNAVLQPRAAVLDGSKFWFMGSTAGLKQGIIGNTTLTDISTSGACMDMKIFGNNIYYTSQASGAVRLQMIEGLPTVSKVAVAQTGIGTTGSIQGFTMFKSSSSATNYDIIYANYSTSTTAEVKKFQLTAEGWVAKGTYSINTGSLTDKNFRGLIGKVINGKAILYANTSSSIVEITDSSSPSSDISASQRQVVELGVNSGKGFKGISFAPGTDVITTLPVELSGFNGIRKGNTAQLTWSTLSETNNSRFDILRSVNGVDFNKISVINGMGNSSERINYSYTDSDPEKGVNYYRLHQVDLDGKATSSTIVAVSFDTEEEFVIHYNNGILEYKVNSNEMMELANISIIDVNGRVMVKQKINLNKGFNKGLLDVGTLNHGVFIATVSRKNGKCVAKFVK